MIILKTDFCKHLDAGMDGMLCSYFGGSTHCDVDNARKCKYFVNKEEDKIILTKSEYDKLISKRGIDINIYGKYKVYYTAKHTIYLGNNEYATDKTVRRKTVDCEKLMHWIHDLINDPEFSSLSIIENTLYIELFNPGNGSGSEIKLKIQESKIKE